MEMTFANLARIAGESDYRARGPITLEEQETLHALRLWAYSSLNEMIEQGIALLDFLQGDIDLEDATGAEDAFEEHEARIGYQGPGDHVADPGGTENEDEDDDPRERDDEDCDGFENEPLFDRAGCNRLNRLYGEGPGGGVLLDSDYSEAD